MMATIKIIFFVLWILCSCLGFEVIWNVPSQQCRQYGLKFESLLRQYGIKVNKDDQFKGEEITIFYEEQLGLYPKLLANGTFVNGGLPQLGNLQSHLEKMTKDISRTIPNKESNGLRVIDWESWRPVWEFNWHPLDKYRKKSIDLVKKNYPDLTDPATINEIAQKQWEDSAKTFMLKTLELAKKLRPNNPWCYYLFPDCYKYDGDSPQEFQCSNGTKKGNDKLSWLWNASTAICPSLYVYENTLEKFSFDQRIWFTNGRLVEASRVAKPNALIYPYISYSVKAGVMVPKEDFWRIMAQIASVGMEGAVIWGSSNSVGSRDYCQDLLKYIVEVIGPASEKITWNYRRCSKDVCNGQGACTWITDESFFAWRLMTGDKGFYAGDISCRCFQGYTGRFCNKKV